MFEAVRPLKKTQILTLLLTLLLIYSIFVTVYALKTRQSLRSRAAFFRRERLRRIRSFAVPKRLPNLANLRKLPEWRAFFASPHFRSFKDSWQLRGLVNSPEFKNLRRSPQWQNLRDSQPLQSLINSPKVTAVRQSASFRALKQSPEFGTLKRNFSRRGALGEPSDFQAFIQSPAFKNFLSSPEAKIFLASPELRNFLGSPELRDFLKSPALKLFLKSPQLKLVAKSPVFRGLSGSLLGLEGLELNPRDLLGSLDLKALGLDSILGDLLKTLLESFLGINLDDITAEPWSTEVLRQDDVGNPTLVRLWTAWDTEGSIVNNLGLGIYTYLIKGNEGVVVWSPGMKYTIGALLAPVLDNLTLETLLDLIGGQLDGKELFVKLMELPCDDPSRLYPLDTSEHIVAAVKKYFPGEKIREIIIPHWHVDHSQDGPRLQKMAEKELGFRPPLRVHAKDKYYPDADGSPGGSESVFEGSCYSSGSWTWGPDLVDGEFLTGTSYRVLHISGHTFGTVDLVSDQDEFGLHTGFPPSMGIGETPSEPSEPSESGESGIFPLEDPAGSDYSKFFNAIPAKGYPTYWLHFPLVTQPEEFSEPTSSSSTTLRLP